MPHLIMAYINARTDKIFFIEICIFDAYILLESLKNQVISVNKQAVFL